jgi:hypothetical protein
MVRLLAVALLLTSFASLAFADGPGIPPDTANAQAKIHAVKLADGPGIPPIVNTNE